jgi:PKD repeat protein
MRTISHTFFLLLITSFFAQAQLSGTYTIGSSGQRNYASFTQAIDTLKSQGISGPVTFNVATGTYYESLTIPEITGASDTSRITFQSATGDSIDVIVSGPGDWTFKLDGADYITLKSMTLTTSSPGTSPAKIINLTSYTENINIVNNYVLGKSNVDPLISGNSSNDSILIKNNYLKNGTYAITFENGNDYLFIIENIIIKCDFGVDLGNFCEKIDICNNTIYTDIQTFYCSSGNKYIKVIGNDIKNTGSGDFYWSSLFFFDCQNLIIENNNIYSSSKYAIRLRGCNTYQGNYQGNISNNFINSLNDGLFLEKTCKNISIKNNTFSCDRICITFSSNSINIDLINNILFTRNNNYTTLSLLSNSSIDTANNNNYYTNHSVLVYWQGDRTNLSQLKSAFPQHNQNSVSIDPQFVSSTDLHCTSIQMNNLGTPIPGITHDIDGDLRSTSTPDIGADEYYNYANDLAILDWVAPLSGVSTPYNGPVSIKIGNVGTQAQSNIPIMYSVDNGNTFIKDTIKTTINPGSISTFTFSTNVSFQNLKVNKCITILGSSADSNRFNDTLRRNIIAYGNVSGTYTIGPDSGFFPSFYEAANVLNNCTISGPVTLLVHPGTYNESVELKQFTGASATNTVTFKPYTGDSTSVIITSDEEYTIKLDSTDYVKFTQLTLRNTSSQTANVVWLGNGANYNEFSNCPMTGSQFVTTADKSQAVVYNHSDNQKDEYNKFINNSLKNGSFGFYWYGRNTSNLEQGNILEGNTIKDFIFQGINSYYQDGIKIKSNIIENKSISTAAHGIYLYYGDNNIEISKNKIHLQGTTELYGIFLQYCDGTTSNRGLIANNFVSLTDSAGTNYGMYIRSRYQDIYCNNINITSGNTSSAALYVDNSSSSYAYHNIKNNNLINSAGGYAIYINRDSYLSSADYNNYQSTGQSIAYWQGDKTTLTALKNAYTSRNQNSISVDPIFVSATDLHTSGAGLVQAGIPLPEVLDDIDGDPRDSIATDLGADEFTIPQMVQAKFSIDNNSQCLSGNQYKFTNKTKLNFGSMTYFWYFGNGDTTTTENPSKTYTVADSFKVKLVVTTNQNLKDSITKTVYVRPQATPDFTINNADQCFVGNNFSFTNASTISSGTLNYKWHFGNGNMSNTTNANQTYNDTGVFAVKLYTTSNYGCKDSVSKNIHVKPNPTSDFSWEQSSIDPYILFTYTGSAKSSANYNWDFGTGQIITGSNAGPYEINWNASGKKQVSLEVTENACPSTKTTKTIDFFKEPISIAIAGDSSVCEGDSIALNATVEPNYTYQWIKDGSPILGATNYFYFVKTNGIYSVEITNTNLNIVKETKPLDIALNTTNFNLDFEVFPDKFTSPPFTPVFQNKTPDKNDYDYVWDYGDGETSTKVQDFHEYKYNGIYSVSLSAVHKTTGCKDSIHQEDAIWCAGGNVDPCQFEAEVTSNRQPIICEGDSILLTATYHNDKLYKWTLDNVIIHQENTFTLMTNEKGNYRVIVIDTANKCTKTSQSFSVSNYPSIKPKIYTSGNIKPCTNDSMMLYTDPYFKNYFWYSAASSQSINTGSTITYVSESGDYYLKVTDYNNCQVVSEPFTVNASYWPAPEICLVTVDSSLKKPKNMIVWERQKTTNIDSYFIYKETTSANVYKKIGSKAYSELSVFVDQNSNPRVKADRYRLSLLDSCGNESALSQPHKTMHVASNIGAGGEINISWSHYEGFQFPTYHIYRGVKPSKMKFVGSVQSNLNSYSDINPPKQKSSFLLGDS